MVISTTQLQKRKTVIKWLTLTDNPYPVQKKGGGLSASDVLKKLIQVGSKMYDEVKDINTAMNTLYTVTDETEKNIRSS